MSFTETVFVAVKDTTKTRYFSSLDQFLKGVAQGYCHDRWNRNAVFPFRLFFPEGELQAWTPAHEALLREALDEVLSWPLPGSQKAKAQNLPWAEQSGKAYTPGSPTSRKIFVEAARTHVHGKVGI